MSEPSIPSTTHLKEMWENCTKDPANLNRLYEFVGALADVTTKLAITVNNLSINPHKNEDHN